MEVSSCEYEHLKNMNKPSCKVGCWSSSHVWQSCGLDTCFLTSYGLAWSTTCGSVSSLQVGISQPKKFYKSPAEIRLLLSRREKWIFNNCGMITNPNPLVGTSLLLAWQSEPTLAFWSERLAKGPYQKNTRGSGARTYNPSIADPSFYQLSYPAAFIFLVRLGHPS